MKKIFEFVKKFCGWIAAFCRRLSENEKFDTLRRVGGTCLFEYFLTLGLTALFLVEIRSWDGAAAALVLTALPVYAFAYLAPTGLSATLAALAAFRFPRAARTVSGIVLWLGTSVLLLLLLADYGMLHCYRRHFGSHELNLLNTPGGFKSMGLRADMILRLALVLAAVFAVNAAAVYLVMFFRRGAAARRLYALFLRSWRKLAGAALLGVLALAATVIFAWNFFMKYPVPLKAAECFPLAQRATMRDFFLGLGLSEPSREELLMRVSDTASLNYPLAPIRRRADRKKYNVVFLVCESWRSTMLSPEVMPRTWDFARRRGIRFTRNISGGNGTRMGVFSLFYGLYGNYWHQFLPARRGALLIDWMLEDGYDISCFTSAKFSYPEFEHTVFARLPESALHSFDEGETYKRDEYNVPKLLDFITGDHGGRPFMAFMFFESPHFPYEFPDENAVFRPFVDKVDYLELGPASAPGITNRYRNCCRTLDGFLGRVFDTLEKRKLWDNTVVVLVGDHGEEIFEHGCLGHNQNFSDIQIHTPLVLFLPGRAPGVYERMSSHLDIPAMLAPFFGVENPASDFSLGSDLLAPGAPGRRYTVVAGWKELFFVGEKYKMQLPQDSVGAITVQAWDADDRELPDRSVVYRECLDQLNRIQEELVRFTK